MAVTAANLIMGPGTLYSGAFGVVEPTLGTFTAPSTGWTDVGGTKDGVTIAFNQTYTALEVDQLTETVGRRRTSSEFTIATNLAEPTLANLAVVSNQLAAAVVVVTGASGYSTLEPDEGPSSTQPNYTALCFDGWGPTQKIRRVIGRRMLSTNNTTAAYTKAAQTVFSVTWTGHYVSSSIKPWSIYDQS